MSFNKMCCISKEFFWVNDYNTQALLGREIVGSSADYFSF